MDGQPNRKKSKGDGVKDIASSSVEPVSGDEGRMEDSVIRERNNYFTPAVMDVWPKILGYVTDPKDVVSVMNASPVLRDLLKKRKASALLPLVLPILLKQNRIALAPHDVFNCRLLNKQVKASVDDLLANERQLKFGYIRQDSWMLINEETVEAFIDGTDDIMGNPFLARRCQVNLYYGEDDQLNNVMDILRRFGGDLLRVCFKLYLNSSQRRVFRVLKRALRYLPNVQRLELDICDIYVQEWQMHKANAAHTPFPSLKALRTLKFSSDDLDSSSYPIITLPPSLVSFVRPILKTYSSQLTTLMFNDLSLIYEPGGSLDFANLLDLKVQFNHIQNSDDFNQVYYNLKDLDCPKLESIILYGGRMRVTAVTFLALNRFRHSLKTLQFTESLARDMAESFQVDPMDLQDFPHLTRLTLCVLDVETPFRHLFRMMFTKLQELRFEPTGLPVNEPPVPDENIRKSYFTIFPHLRRITWLQRWGMEPTVFLR